MDKKFRVLIVEDEFITLDNLKDAMEEIGYEISGAVMKAEDAINVLEKEMTDIALLDIHLKNSKSGIWLAVQIRKKYKIPFIFLSAFTDKNTVGVAAKVRPSSYLVKPFTKEDIFTAIEVAMNNFKASKQAVDWKEEEDTLIHKSIFIKDGKIYKKIRLSEIRYVEAFKNYLELHAVNQRYVIRSTLKKFLEKLPSPPFFQTHRSYVVNKNFIEEATNNYVLIEGVQVPISRGFREGIINELGLA